MHAPRVKFERIYIVSPIKVVIVFLTILHTLSLCITILTSFWIETPLGHYGPLFSCEKRVINIKKTLSMITECYSGGFIYDMTFFRILPLSGLLIILSFILSIISILTANMSFMRYNSSVRHRYWLCTTLLLLIICLIDCFLLVFIPLSYHHQIYYLQWAYGLHCGATLFISVSLIAAILLRHDDDIQYIETVDDSVIEK
jgi:hypothetical protein